MVGVVAVINAVLPAIGRAGNALVTSAEVADTRLSTRIEIIHATGQDLAVEAEAWVKNTGAVRIIAIAKTDVFFGPETDFDRIPYGGAGCTAPCWEFEIENDTVWNKTATLHLTIHLEAADALAAGTTYFIKVVSPIGVEDSKFFTL